MEVWRACMSRCKHAYWCRTQMNASVPWVCPGDLHRDSEPSSRLWFLAAIRLSPSTPGSICLFLALVPAGRRPPLLPTKRPGVGGRGRPRLARSSWLIFPATIDPAVSPESISSRQVKISPIVSPDLRQGGIHSNLFKQRRAIPSHFYSNLFQGEEGQAGRPELDPGLVHWVSCASQGGSWCHPEFLGGCSVGSWEGGLPAFPASFAWLPG